MGGVQSAAHARDLLDAGATLVAVGTESFRDPARGRADRSASCSELSANCGGSADRTGYAADRASDKNPCKRAMQPSSSLDMT